MRTGLFFEAEDTKGERSKDIFRYRKIRLKNQVEPFETNLKFYPISVVFSKVSIEFYFRELNAPTHKKILELPLYDSTSSPNTISKRVESCSSKPIEAQLGIKSKKCTPLEEDQIPIISYNLEYLHCNKCRNTIISAKQLFLDFLFDLKHSHVFKRSKYYDLVFNKVNQSLLVKAILAKAEYTYQEKLAQNGIGDEKIFKKRLNPALNSWVEIILDKESPELIGNSTWFKDDLEVEIKEVLFNKQENPTARLDSKLSEKIMDFYLGRLNYEAASDFTFKYHNPHGGLYFILWLGITFLIFLSWSWVFGAIIPLLCLLIWFDYKFNKNSRSKKPFKRSLPSVLSLFMPRLFISLIFTWITFLPLIDKTLQLDWYYSILYFIGLTIPIKFYLSRELRKLAPDLEISKINLRPIPLIAWAYIYSGIIGIFVLSIAIRSNLEIKLNLVQMGEFEVAFETWLNATIFAVFIGLFFNILFRGEKFTGF